MAARFARRHWSLVAPSSALCCRLKSMSRVEGSGGDVTTVKVIIADDHFAVRAGLRLLLEQMPGMQVIHEASDGDDLLEAAGRLEPGLVLTDITMPGMDGFAALSELRRTLPAIKLLVVSLHDAPHMVRRAVRCGANGYLLKGGSRMELEHALRSLLAGRAYFCPDVTLRLLEPPEVDAREVLTARQIDISRLLASGLTSKEIAFRLGLSSKTVDAHRARILERLQINDLATLALYCARQGLIDPNRPIT
ncbi:MAG: DNA-binding response regulator [Comamonadaceae bacterium]|nr:DNA-binding response regulator [Comamonadaceae bacterium]